MAGTTTAVSGAAALMTKSATGLIVNVRLMKALTQKGYDVNYSSSMNLARPEIRRYDSARDDALAVARRPGLHRSERYRGALVPPTRGDEAIAMPVSVGDKFGSYEILAPLGAGGMGEVYKARDTRLGRTVALKLLPSELASDPVSRRRLLQEAQAASSLNHPNIVVMYDISSHEGRDFLVMEYVPGRTLKDLIPPGGLPFDQLAGLGSQVALALGAAHAAGIVHRDVKPANIIVTLHGQSDRQAKVLDFGIARISGGIAQGDTVTNLTGAGHVIGTVAYMSPEQVRGGEADFRSDIFALGCVLYEAATGHRPFEAGNNLRLMHEISTTDPDSLNGPPFPDLSSRIRPPGDALSRARVPTGVPSRRSSWRPS